MTFRPFPGFTLFAAVMIALLCGLGVWQLQRLQWKLALIAEIQQGLSSPPADLADVLRAPPGTLLNPSSADYRKVRLRGRFRHRDEMRFFATDSDGAPVYHVLTPFAPDHGLPIIVDRGVIPLRLADPATRPAGQVSGTRSLIGILRAPDRPSWFTPPIDVPHRIVHTRDPAALAAAFGLGPVSPLFVEAGAAPNPGGWPKGGQTVIDLPNNHLSYAATWFGLALGLFGVWLAYHISKGRFALK